MTAGVVARALARLRAAHRRVRDGADSGVTLMEVVVAMTIMTIAGSIFVGAVVTLHRTTSQAQAITGSATSNNQVYQALDRTVRYAAAVTTPGRSATGRWYVELRHTTTGTEVCTQLRIDTAAGQLQRRTWQAADLGTLTPWRQVAAGISNGGAAPGSADQPFRVPTPGPTVQHQELEVRMVSTSGPANQQVSSRSRFTLAALNSTIPPATGAVCQQAGRQ